MQCLLLQRQPTPKLLGHLSVGLHTQTVLSNASQEFYSLPWFLQGEAYGFIFRLQISVVGSLKGCAEMGQLKKSMKENFAEGGSSAWLAGASASKRQSFSWGAPVQEACRLMITMIFPKLAFFVSFLLPAAYPCAVHQVIDLYKPGEKHDCQ